MSVTAPLCRICQQPIADRDDGMTCYYCGQDFHFARSTKSPVKDCGTYHFDPDGVALVFMCQTCVDEVGLPNEG